MVKMKTYELSAFALLNESLEEIEDFMNSGAAETASENEMEEIISKAYVLQFQILTWKDKNPFIGLEDLAERVKKAISILDREEVREEDQEIEPIGVEL